MLSVFSALAAYFWQAKLHNKFISMFRDASKFLCHSIAFIAPVFGRPTCRTVAFLLPTPDGNGCRPNQNHNRAEHFVDTLASTRLGGTFAIISTAIFLSIRMVGSSSSSSGNLTYITIHIPLQSPLLEFTFVFAKLLLAAFTLWLTFVALTVNATMVAFA